MTKTNQQNKAPNNSQDKSTNLALSLDALFNDDSFYAVIDSAMDNHVYLQIMGEALDWRSLYRNEEAELLEEVAPYLVFLKKGHSFTQWIIDEVYGKNAVSFIHSQQDINTLASHLSEYAKIKIPMRSNNNVEQEMQWAFFAFYDPRVFPQFVETNTEKQNAGFFQGISNYYCEDTQNIKQLNSYEHYSDTLQEKTISLEKVSEQPLELESSSITKNKEGQTHG